jgi:hypothetical protein
VKNQIIIFILAWSLTGCYLSEELPPDQQTWDYRTPAETGLSNESLRSLNNALNDRNYGQVFSLSIIRGEHLIFENYYNYSNRNQIISLGSTTFSFMVLFLDLLRQDGYLEDLNQPIHELLPEYAQIFNQDPLKKEITIQHLLDFNSGLVWREGQYPNDPGNDYIKMKDSEDWVEYVLSAPLESNPGQRISRHQGAGILFSKIYQNLIGSEPLIEYFDERVFQVMNINHYTWSTDGNGLLNGVDGLALSNLDYAKLGYLILKDGRWTNQERIIGREWVYELAFNTEGLEDSFKFQYGWWKFSNSFLNNFFSRADYMVMLTGNQGKTMYLLPEEEMVITIMANHSDASAVYNPSFLVLSRVISSISGSNSLQ